MSKQILAPMPGKINSIIVAAGAEVLAKQELFIMESMKMEMPIVAPVAGTVDQIQVSEGQSVDKDTVLATIV